MTQTSNAKLPPALIVGGAANALSVARSLGAAGVDVYALNQPQESVGRSRFCRELISVAGEGDLETRWANWLLSSQSDRLRGAVLLACSDEGLTIVARHRETLARKFTLDICNTDAQQRMLNKLDTYRIAKDAGVTTPKWWLASSRTEITSVASELVYPLLVKPKYSHQFTRKFNGKKFVVANNLGEVLAAYDSVNAAGLEVMLVELIPGGDDKLCSYYTYLDESGEPQVHFTKRIIRRYPVGMGNACYHITDRNPKVQEAALKLFKAAGLIGLANAEFKLDDRDGQLKLIECNARFTAANCLVAASGIDLARFVYDRLVGRTPSKRVAEYRSGLRLWYPIQDFRAYRQLRAKGALSFGRWLTGVMRYQTFPYWRWNDPMPSLVGLWREIKGIFKGRLPWSRKSSAPASNAPPSSSRQQVNAVAAATPVPEAVG